MSYLTGTVAAETELLEDDTAVSNSGGGCPMPSA